MIFDDRVAIVAGGTSGMGQASAIALAQNGANVAVAGRPTEQGEKMIAMIKEIGGEAVFHKTDVTKALDVETMVVKAVETFSRLNIAFNNAGYH